MPKQTIQTNVHGRRFGLSKNNELIFNQANVLQEDAILIPKHHVMIELTAAQIQSGNGTPVELVAAPGTGFSLLVSEVRVSKAAGTAFAGVASGEDIQIEYGALNIPVVTDIETTGFLDQTTDELRIVRAIDPTLGFDFTAAANDNIEYTLLVGDITGGSPVVFDVYYELIDLTALVA